MIINLMDKIRKDGNDLQGRKIFESNLKAVEIYEYSKKNIRQNEVSKTLNDFTGNNSVVYFNSPMDTIKMTESIKSSVNQFNDRNTPSVFEDKEVDLKNAVTNLKEKSKEDVSIER